MIAKGHRHGLGPRFSEMGQAIWPSPDQAAQEPTVNPALLLPRAALRAAGEPAAAQRDHRRGWHLRWKPWPICPPPLCNMLSLRPLARTRLSTTPSPARPGVTLANAANGFTAVVQSGALQIAAGTDTWGMTLAGLSYGATIRATGNRPDLGQRQPRGLQLRGDRPVVRQRPRRIGAGL